MSISVLCANYNNAAYLDDFFSSLLKSTVVPDEIVFVDDGSSDASLSVVKKYRDLINIVLISLESNVGFANALNIGLSKCSCDYIARVDPDDIVVPQRFERQLLAFSDQSIDVVGSQASYFLSETGLHINYTNMPLGYDAIRRAYYSCDNGVLHGTVTVRSMAFKKYLYRQQFVPSEDYDIFCRMMSDGMIFSNIDEPLTLVRVHSASVSNSIRFSTIDKIYKLRREILGIGYYNISAYVYFWHIYLYRRYLFSSTVPARLFFGGCASVLHPMKALRRMNRWVVRFFR